MDADALMIGTRLALYCALGLLFGLSAFGLYGLDEGERRTSFPLRAWLIATSVLGLVFSAAALLLVAAAMTGTTSWPIDFDAIEMVLSGSATGTAWTIRMAALVIAGVAAITGGVRTERLVAIVIASAVSLSTLAWAGHGAMDEGSTGWVHLASDIFHLIAAGAWTGALLGLILLVARPVSTTDTSHLILTNRALHQFGAVGTIVVATLGITGLTNSWLTLGTDGIMAAGTTLYGRLLLLKLALFAAMLALASLNRFRFTPKFSGVMARGEFRSPLVALRWSLAAEAACAFAILGIVAWLGTLDPHPA